MISTRRRPVVYTSTLDPFPEGWYYVASRSELLKSRLIQKTWMGENEIVWCDDSGRVCVAEATCPHLGADPGAGRWWPHSRWTAGLSLPRVHVRLYRPVRRNVLRGAAQDRNPAGLRNL